MQGVNCVKGEIHSVLTALRIHSNDASNSRKDYPTRKLENPLIRKLKNLYDQLANTNDLTLIDTAEVFDPFLSCITGATNAIVTESALHATHKFLMYGHITAGSFNAAAAMSNIAHSVAQCQFDAKSAGEAEVVYMKSLQLLVECLRCPAGALLTDDAVCAMVTQTYTIRSRGRITKLLRTYADNALLQMVLVIFARLSPDTKTGGEKAIEWTSSPPDKKFLQKGSDTPSSRYIPYGVHTMERVLQFLVKLMDQSRKNSSTEVMELGCMLVRTAFETAGSKIGNFPPLVRVIQDDLCKRVLQNSQIKNLNLLSLNLRIVYDLFNTVKEHLKVQLEVFFTSIHMRIGEGEGSSFEEKELVLESLVEFCNDDNLIVGLYRNYDCEVSSTNLYEDLCKFLNRCALPPQETKEDSSGAFDRLRVLSLEGILSMVQSLARRFGSEDGISELGRQDKKTMSSRENKTIEENRKRKMKLTMAAKRFNQHGHKAFSYIKSLGGVLAADNDPVEIVRFLRSTPGLDKKKIGELLGSSKPLNQKVMEYYIESFSFPFPKTEAYRPVEKSKEGTKQESNGDGSSENVAGAPENNEEDSSDLLIHKDTNGIWITGRVDRGLRILMQEFRLAGEAQQINRIIEAFSNSFYSLSPGPLRNTDACYLLTYAVMMLHTDAHNPRVSKKMSKPSFSASLAGCNDKHDFPKEYLSQIYDEITTKEFKVLSGMVGDLKEIDESWNKLVQRSKQTGPFQVHLAAAHGREMFSILWDHVESMIMHYFDNPDLYADLNSTVTMSQRSRRQSRRQERRLLLNKISFGLYGVAKLCSVYSLNHILDRLLSSLATRLIKQLDIALLGGGSSIAKRARFGRSRQAQKLSHLLFDMLAKYGGKHAMKTWNHAITVILQYHELSLLPEALLQKFDYSLNEEPLASLRKLKAPSPKREVSTGSSTGMFSLITSSITMMFASADYEEDEKEDSGWSSSDAEGEDEESRIQKLAAVGSACVATYGIPTLFISTSAWAPSSLTHIMQALTHVASPNQSKDSNKSDTNSEQKEEPQTFSDSVVAFAIERLTEIVIANKHRAFNDKIPLFRPVVSVLQSILQKGADNPTYLTERAVVCLFRLATNLSVPSSQLGELVIACSSPARILRPTAFYALGTRIVAGVKDFISCHPEVTSPPHITALFSLLSHFRYHSKAAKPAFSIVAFLTSNLKSPSAFRAGISSLCTFFPPDNASTQWELIPTHSIFDSLISLHKMIPTWTSIRNEKNISFPSKSISGNSQADFKSMPERSSLWLYSIGTLCSLCGHTRDSVKHQALAAIRRALLTTGWVCEDSQSWKTLFMDIMLPMLSKLCNIEANTQKSPVVGRKNNRGDKKKQDKDLRIEAAALIFQVFLQHLNILGELKDFSVFWLKFLGSIEKLSYTFL